MGRTLIQGYKKTMDITIEKQKKRKYFFDLIKSRSIIELRSVSELIASKLFEMDKIKNANRIFAYYPLKDEVDILPLLLHYREVKPVFLPRVVNNNVIMYRFTEHKLQRDEKGILAPAADGLNDVPSVGDVILVPGIAFDRKKNRIGRGEGFYDRYLTSHGIDAIKIGIIFSEFLFDSLPFDEKDIPMNLVVTHNEIVE